MVNTDATDVLEAGEARAAAPAGPELPADPEAHGPEPDTVPAAPLLTPALLQHLISQWWYYTVELAPGALARGQYASNRPMPPRTLMRRIDLSGTSCLDLGSMEGLMPVLMKLGGAHQVLATDFNDHCLEKMAAVCHAYGVDFEYQSVGLMHSLSHRLSGRSFDLINCSGLLYHVWSPLHVLASVRPLLRQDGVMIVSTYTVDRDEMVAEFNHRGALDNESNTFWYLSLPLLDYALRYLRLTPVDVHYYPLGLHGAAGHTDHGYVSIACRATGPVAADPWMARSMAESWEFLGYCDWAMADAQPRSTIRFKDGGGTASIDVPTAVRSGTWPIAVETPADAHVLRLSDCT